MAIRFRACGTGWHLASVISVQAKDVVVSGYSAAGAGLMDYSGVFRQLARLAPVPVIVQDAHEGDAARVRDDLRWYDEANAREISACE